MKWQSPRRAAARWQHASSSSFVFSPQMGPFLLPLPSSSLENVMTKEPSPAQGSRHPFPSSAFLWYGSSGDITMSALEGLSVA